MLFNYFRLLIYSIIICLIFSCNSTDEIESNTPLKLNFEVGTKFTTNQLNKYSIQEVNNMREQVALNLATMVKEKEIRKTLFDKVNQKFDGDFQVLFYDLKKSTTSSTSSNARSSNVTFEEHFFNNLNQNSNHRVTSTNNLKEVINSNPLLNIAIPYINSEFNSENQDYSNSDILVTWLPVEFEDSKETTLTAFDTKGDIHYISSITPPNKLVIVVGDNERNFATLLDPSFDQPIYTFDLLNPNYNANARIVERELLRDPGRGDYGGGGGGGSSTPTPTPTRATTNKTDKINKAKFNSLSSKRAVESYVKGDAEVYVVVVIASNIQGRSLTVKKFFDGGWVDHDIFTNWTVTRNIDTEIYNWDLDSQGNLMLYEWWEQDGGGTLTVSSGFQTTIENTSVSINATYQVCDKDTEIGSSLVAYDDPIAGEGTEYNTGRLKFWINQ